MRIALFAVVCDHASVVDATPVDADEAVLEVSTRMGLDVTEAVLPTLSVPVSVYT
jgi:hypothetical protein